MDTDNKKLTWTDVINQIDLIGPRCKDCGEEIPLGTINVFGFCGICAEKRFKDYAALRSRLQQAEADNAALVEALEKIEDIAVKHDIETMYYSVLGPLSLSHPGAALLEELETYKKALELASELHCVAGSCPNDDDCNDTGDCEKCWCNYFLTQAKEAAHAE